MRSQRIDARFRAVMAFMLLVLGNSLCAPAWAEDHSLREKSQNPIGSLISVPFQNTTNFGVGALDNTQNVLLFQPVAPITLDPMDVLVPGGLNWLDELQKLCGHLIS